MLGASHANRLGSVAVDLLLRRHAQDVAHRHPEGVQARLALREVEHSGPIRGATGEGSTQDGRARGHGGSIVKRHVNSSHLDEGVTEILGHRDLLRGGIVQFHGLLELFGGDDVGGLVHVTSRARTKSDAHFGLPVAGAGAAIAGLARVQTPGPGRVRVNVAQVYRCKRGDEGPIPGSASPFMACSKSMEARPLLSPEISLFVLFMKRRAVRSIETQQ